MSRRLVVVACLVGLITGAGVVSATADAPANACDSVYTSNTIANLKRYDDCRFDRLEAKLDRLASPSPSSSSSSGTSSSPSPSGTPTPTPTPTSTGAAGICQPGSEIVKFDGQGSAGLDAWGPAGYDASAELWGVSGYSYSQQMGVCSHDAWYVTVTTDNSKGDGAVKAYPSMRRIYHDYGVNDFSKDPKLSSFPKLTIDFAATGPATCSSCIYDTAFDLWLEGIANSTSVEVMYWTENVKQVPFGTKVASGIQFGGHTFDLYAGNSNHYLAYVPTDVASIPSGTLDVKALVADLAGRGRIVADPKVSQLSYGVETVSTNSVAKTWDFTKFTVNEA